MLECQVDEVCVAPEEGGAGGEYEACVNLGESGVEGEVVITGKMT